VAAFEAQRIKASPEKSAFCVVHKKEGDTDFIAAFLKEMDDNIVCVITVGDEKLGPGQLVVTGPTHHVQSIGTLLCDELDGKGGGKSRFNAKINNLKNVSCIEKIVSEYFNKIL